MLFLSGSFIPVSMAWDYEPYAAFLRRMAGIGRLIQYDRRGVGFSDPVVQGQAGTLDELIDDAIAVLDAVGSETATVVGVGFTAMTAISLTCRHPHRFDKVVLYSPVVRILEGPEFPLGIPREQSAAMLSEALEGHDDGPSLSPQAEEDEELAQYLDRAGRIGASPGSARSIYESFIEHDVNPLLPHVQHPVLAMTRPVAGSIGPPQAEWVADRVPDGRYVELPGEHYLPFVGEPDAFLREVESFITGVSGAAEAERVLRVLVLTDLVGSTEQAARLGDHEWRLRLDRHDELADEALRRYGGTKINTTGDGLIASFLTASGALGFARDLCAALQGIGLSMRSGVHVGEVEQRGNDVGGLAVNLTARIADLGGPCEVLVSSVVPLIVEGAGFTFEEVGPRELRGVGFPVTLYRLGIGP